MKLSRLFLYSGLFAASVPAWAVYAPIPEQDQGKSLLVSARGAITYDDNIFGSPTNEIDSMVYSFVPKIAFNGNITDQTFISAAYTLSLDYFTDRPGKDLLDSHEFMARVAQSFTPVTTLDLSDNYSIQRNPEALLAGVPVNTDQSFDHNEFNARFDTKFTEKFNFTLKARSIYFSYDNANLGSILDRTENLYGISGGYSLEPELKVVGEYRHQDINYRKFGFNNNKSSDFALVGGDYNLNKKLTSTARVGVEYRQRDNEADQTAPYVELTGKYDYATGAYISAGYIYTLEEASNTLIYTDTDVNRFFVNVQHPVTSLITLSGSADYEPSTLNGRRGLRDVDETTYRLGGAVSYLATKNLTVSATYDYDHTSSDDAARNLKRNRIGIAAVFAF